jgi:superfamily II DNA or RNA helicase
VKEYPKGIQFKYKWRKYQQRVLEELQEHLTDEHLHVIAPPGSGKTVLGLLSAQFDNSIEHVNKWR